MRGTKRTSQVLAGDLCRVTYGSKSCTRTELRSGNWISAAKSAAFQSGEQRIDCDDVRVIIRLACVEIPTIRLACVEISTLARTSNVESFVSLRLSDLRHALDEFLGEGPLGIP
jgi:hypothetical protein